MDSLVSKSKVNSDQNSYGFHWKADPSDSDLISQIRNRNSFNWYNEHLILGNLVTQLLVSEWNAIWMIFQVYQHYKYQCKLSAILVTNTYPSIQRQQALKGGVGTCPIKVMNSPYWTLLWTGSRIFRIMLLTFSLAPSVNQGMTQHMMVSCLSFEKNVFQNILGKWQPCKCLSQNNGMTLLSKWCLHHDNSKKKYQRKFLQKN